MSAPLIRRFVTTTLFCAAASAIAGYFSASVLILIIIGFIHIAP